MTPAEFEKQMDALHCAHKYDPEAFHVLADKLMERVLEELGYGAGVEIFRAADKYYS